MILTVCCCLSQIFGRSFECLLFVYCVPPKEHCHVRTEDVGPVFLHKKYTKCKPFQLLAVHSTTQELKCLQKYIKTERKTTALKAGTEAPTLLTGTESNLSIGYFTLRLM